jgi:hypothetical protein
VIGRSEFVCSNLSPHKQAQSLPNPLRYPVNLKKQDNENQFFVDILNSKVIVD